MSAPGESAGTGMARTVRRVPSLASALVIAVGVMVLIGWALRLPLLLSGFPHLPAMMPNTATALVLAGTALWLLAPPGASGWRRWLGHGSALLVALFGAVVLAEYAAGWRLGLDLWLFRGEVVAGATRFPGRPGPHTAVAFTLVGLALALLDADRRRGHRPALLLAPLSATVTLVALLGHAYHVSYLYQLTTGTGMALHTALAFLLLNAGLLACRPERQPASTFLAPGPAGLMARRLVPTLLLGPLCVGGLMLLGERDRLFEPAFGTALATVAMLIALTLVVLVTARDLERLDQVRRASQNQLLEAERRFRRVTDAATDAILSADGGGRLRSWNKGAEAMFGWRAEEVVGGPLTVIMPERLRALHLEGLERVRRSGHSRLAGGVVELVGLRRDGTEFPVELSIGIWWSGGAVWFSGVIRDITGRKQAEEALRQAKLAAEEANHAKSEYLSRISHELRTPLNAILGFAQLLELDDLNPEQRDSLRHILLGGEHLLALINQVLDIAAIEAGRLPLSLEPVAVAEVVTEAVGLIRPLAGQCGVLLAEPGPPCDHHVLGDRQRLAQVLLNLLSNAVRYNREGGSVRLACEPVEGGRLRLSVTDTGPGIAPEARELLFVPFERLSGAQSAQQGSGLGLPLSRRLAEAMGGTLDLSSTVGQGSRFWVELPMAEAPLERAGLQQADSDPGPGARAPLPEDPALTVLCIEDNLSNLELVERVLSRRPGVRLISAMRPQLGLDLAGEHRPDLVLLDLHLPDMPGGEVLRRLRACPKTADVPVAILTADARPGLTSRLLDQGARALLTKPLDVKELLALLDAIAAEHRPNSLGATGS